jgi:hypothetical protein
MNVKKYAAADGALFLILMRLQLCCAYGAKGEVMGRFFRLIKIMLPLAIVSACLLGYVLNSQSGIFREFEAAMLSVQWMLLVCIAVWCGTFIFLTFSLNDWPLIGLLLIAIVAFFVSYATSWRAADAIILLAGVTLGKGARVLLSRSSRRESALTEKSEIRNQKSEIDQSGLTSAATFIVGLVGLLAFASWWHLDAMGAYHGPRWTGLWDNPNIYGMLMGARVVLAIGLLAQNLKSEKLKAEIEEGRTENRKRNLLQILKTESRKQKLLIGFLFVAVFMMGVGLGMSYSRGAWVGTAVGLLYLAKAHGKLKWRLVLPGILVVAVAVGFFWHSTGDTDAWYLKRLDLSRPSAQHRVSAWRAAVQMMRDHPLGVGWNKAVGVYDKNYSPPENGAAALTMNSYLMLGTELGLPGLICFAGYVGLCYRKSPRPYLAVGLAPSSQPSPPVGEKVSAGRMRGSASADLLIVAQSEALRAACLAGALVLVVAFWLDGGLFTLATAAVFWILLELGAERQKLKTEMLKAENQKVGTDLSLVPSSPGCGATSTSAATK